MPPTAPSVAYAGLAIARQRPSTAKGIVFMLLEDEHGQVNLIVPSQVYEQHRAIVRGEPLLLARGRFERVGREPQHARLLAGEPRPRSPAASPKRRRRPPHCRAPTTSATGKGRKIR